MHVENVEVIPERLSIGRRDWLLILVAFVVSRVVLYAIGYFGAMHYNIETDYIDAMNITQAVDGDIQSMFCQFDCGWFQSIADVGYDTYPHGLKTGHAANWAFLPGFPMAGYWVGDLLGQDLETSRFGVWLLAFSPFSIYFIAPYTESSFLLFTLAVFLCAYRRRWLWVGVAGALMAATRNLGVMVVFPVVILALQAYGWRELLRFGDRTWRVLLALWVIPFALFSFMLYLHLHVGDGFAFKNIQLAWGRIFDNPFHYWLEGFETGGRKYYLSVVSLLGWAMNGYLLYQRRYAEALFMLICTMVPIVTSTNAFPRYLFGLYPTMLVMALFVRNKPIMRPLILALSALLAGYFTIAWVTAKFFVV